MSTIASWARIAWPYCPPESVVGPTLPHDAGGGTAEVEPRRLPPISRAGQQFAHLERRAIVPFRWGAVSQFRHQLSQHYPSSHLQGGRPSADLCAGAPRYRYVACTAFVAKLVGRLEPDASHTRGDGRGEDGDAAPVSVIRTRCLILVQLLLAPCRLAHWALARVCPSQQRPSQR